MITRTAATFDPPIMAARGWLKDATFPPDRPLIDVSQAAPAEAPPEALREEIARVVRDVPSAHLYGPVLGLPALRDALAGQIAGHYAGTVSSEQVAITSGCNQAFCAAIAALTGEGDEILLPTPWYFNHAMWLSMAGVTGVPLPTGETLLPDVDDAASRITDRTRAIVLVTPNNPAGAEYPAGLVHAFYALAQSRGIKLILDETYRDFDSRPARPHDLISDPDWPDTLIHLYSFSKAYRLSGHRIGALVSGTPFVAEAEKFLDTVTICASQIGQHAALWGIQNLQQWLAEQRDEIMARRAAIETGFPQLEAQGWRLKGVGAYFAYVEHPSPLPAPDVAKRLVREAGVLALPGTMFAPEGDADAPRHLRVAFANLDRDGIARLFTRLGAHRF
ncbi:aminotransferase [Chachezhania antarctica]|uniref:aminotransferase n=1 Tax=Chachezhania antarctica TaxID=2340860 RepID=UPI000EABD276|nr:aminotransferase [Chachezhania antarctica]